MAAIGIDISEIDRLAEPVGAKAVCVMTSSAGDSYAVKPPTTTA